MRANNDKVFNGIESLKIGIKGILITTDPESLDIIGGGERDRTADLYVANVNIWEEQGTTGNIKDNKKSISYVTLSTTGKDREKQGNWGVFLPIC